VATETWQIDPVHSGIHFSIRHFVVGKVHGRFTKLGGTIQLDEANPANSKSGGQYRRGQCRYQRREARRAFENRGFLPMWRSTPQSLSRARA